METDIKKLKEIADDQKSFDLFYEKALKFKDKGVLDPAYGDFAKDLLLGEHLDEEAKERIKNLLLIYEEAKK